MPLPWHLRMTSALSSIAKLCFLLQAENPLRQASGASPNAWGWLALEAGLGVLLAVSVLAAVVLSLSGDEGGRVASVCMLLLLIPTALMSCGLLASVVQSVFARPGAWS